VARNVVFISLGLDGNGVKNLSRSGVTRVNASKGDKRYLELRTVDVFIAIKVKFDPTKTKVE
jgi:hypothetical protein